MSSTRLQRHGKQIAILTLIAGSLAMPQLAMAQQADLLVSSGNIADAPRTTPASPTGAVDNPYKCTIETSLLGIKNAPVGSMIYFDVKVGPWPIDVNRLYQNVSTAFGTPYHFDVYTTPDTYVGKFSDPAHWTLQASGDGVSQGQGVLSDSTLTNSFTLDADASYGFGIHITDTGHVYHNGNGTNEFYENKFLSLQMGVLTFTPFGASGFNPRIWNGAIEYNSPTCACPHACNFGTGGHCVCDIFSFLSFQNSFVNGEVCACDIDVSTGVGVCDIFDFLAFQNEFVSPCP